MIKKIGKLGTEGKYLNTVKATSAKVTANIILIRDISLKSKTNKLWFTPLLFHRTPEVLEKASNQEEELKDFLIINEDTGHRWHDIVYKELPKDPIKKTC